MVQFGVSLVSIIIELIQLFASEGDQFTFKILIVFCLLGKKWEWLFSVMLTLYFQYKWHIQSVLIDTYAFTKNHMHWKWIAWCHKPTLLLAPPVAVMAIETARSSMLCIPLLDDHKLSTAIPLLKLIATLVNVQVINHHHTLRYMLANLLRINLSSSK